MVREAVVAYHWHRRFGFAAALAANLAFQFRNMYSKKYMVENSMDSFEAGGNYTGLDEVRLGGTNVAFLEMPTLSDNKEMDQGQYP